MRTEIRWGGRNGFRGRIQFEVAGMYTGTLISDLMTAVERAGQVAEQQRAVKERELHAIYSMQIPLVEGDQVFMGAA